MRILELYSGTQSISKEFRAKGHTTLCVEINELFTKEPYNLEQYTIDINKLTINKIINKLGGLPDVIWASPTCATHSVAAIHRHRTKKGKLLYPTSDKARSHDETLIKTLNIIQELRPKLFFIENPRAGMRKSPYMQGVMFRYTVTYCQYGDTRMKATDIWTNHPYPQFKPTCNFGDDCHEPAPRGSRTGTQGITSAIDKSRIPPLLCKHIVKISEDYVLGDDDEDSDCM